MKIVYNIAGTYRSGGMERVLSNKANWLSRNGYEVVIVTTDQQNRRPFFPLEKSIRCIDLGINYEENNGYSFLNKIIHYPAKREQHKAKLKAVLFRERPDIVISMFCNDADFLYKIKDDSKKVIEAHFCHDKMLMYGRKGLWRAADIYRTWKNDRIVNKYDKLVILTEEDATDWPDLPNLAVIPNARTYEMTSKSSLDAKRVVAIGRYTHQKGLERLIMAWSMIAPSIPGWRLDLIGEGDEEKDLQKLIDAVGSGSIWLYGTTNDIPTELMNSSLLVLPSRYEGFGMVLVEAMSYGVPPIAFSCKCGPSDIIKDGEDGILVKEGDIVELSKAILMLINNAEMRKQMGSRAFESSKKYSEDVIMSKWKALFEELL